MNQQIISKSYNRNGLLFGLFISADMIIKIFNYLFSFQNILVFYYLAIIACAVIVNNFKFNIRYIFLYIMIVVLFGLSFLRLTDTTYGFQYLIYFSCFYLGSYMLQFQINVHKVFKTVNIINIFYALYLYFVIFKRHEQGLLVIDQTMDLSYTSLIGVASFLLSFILLNYKQSKMFILISFFAVLIELHFMIFISYNRGALLALILLFTLFFIRKIKRTPYRLFSFGVMTLLGVYLFANLQTVLIYVYNFLAKNNISVNFLSKSISSLTLEDFSSGRTSLYESAMILFNKSPIFGNGIGHFASLHNGQYPHNLFLESLTDQGVLITAVLFIFCLICVYKFLTTEQNNLLILAVLLFSLSLPRLMISSTVWMSPFFWALVVIILINPSFRNTKTI